MERLLPIMCSARIKLLLNDNSESMRISNTIYFNPRPKTEG